MVTSRRNDSKLRPFNMNSSENTTGDAELQAGYPNGGNWWEGMQRWAPTRVVEFFKSFLGKRSVAGFGFGVEQEVPPTLMELGISSGAAEWHGDVSMVFGHPKTCYCLRVGQKVADPSSDTFSLLVDFDRGGAIVRAATQVSRGPDFDTPLNGWSPQHGNEGLLDFAEGRIEKVADYTGSAQWPDIEGLIATLLTAMERAFAAGLGRGTP